MMPKFKKKPIVIEAVQFLTADDEWRVRSFMLETGEESHAIGIPPYALEIATLEGKMRVDFGDWVIRGVKNEYYPCKPDIFDATYERVDD